MLGIKLGVNLEVKLGVGSKTGSKNSVLAFLKCMEGSVLAFLKCTDRSVLVFLKCMDGSVLAHLRFPMQSAPTRFPQSGNSEVPSYIRHKDLFRPSPPSFSSVRHDQGTPPARILKRAGLESSGRIASS